MQLTERLRIYPTFEQEEVLWSLSEQCRLIYNFALAQRKKEWTLNNLRDDLGVFPWGKPYYSVDYKKQQNDLPKIKEKYPKYKVVYSKVLQMTIRTLNADYNSFFEQRKNGDTNAHPPGFKGKDHFTTMMYNQSGFTIKGQKISLSHYYNDVPLVFELLRNYNKVYQVNVSQAEGKYYLGIVHEVPEKPYVD
ncbi:MAG: transposase, partial [Candidatus Methanoperedens sp.]|nr:transposase [Candidatus Methanoperedens sp.]